MKKKQPTKEALALAAAIASNNLTHAAVADHVGAQESQVSHWVTSHRPVPIDKAERLAEYLGVAPEKICARYGKSVRAVNGSSVVLLPSAVGDERRSDLVIARLENDVDALRYALGALTAAMVIHRPAEAADVAKALRKHVPAKFVNHGFVAELLRALDKGA